jgi:hypothetical protein
LSIIRDKSGASTYFDGDNVHIFSEAWVGMAKTPISLVASIGRSEVEFTSQLGKALRCALEQFIENVEPHELNSRCTHSVQSVLGVKDAQLNAALRTVGAAYLGFAARFPAFYVGAWVAGPRGKATPLLDSDILLAPDTSDEELGRVMLDVLERSRSATLELAAAPPKPKRTRVKKAPQA